MWPNPHHKVSLRWHLSDAQDMVVYVATAELTRGGAQSRQGPFMLGLLETSILLHPRHWHDVDLDEQDNAICLGEEAIKVYPDTSGS